MMRKMLELASFVRQKKFNTIEYKEYMLVMKTNAMKSSE